jgi:hypothetical protein
MVIQMHTDLLYNQRTGFFFKCEIEQRVEDIPLNTRGRRKKEIRNMKPISKKITEEQLMKYTKPMLEP